jgi:hypothetical protein
MVRARRRLLIKYVMACWQQIGGPFIRHGVKAAYVCPGSLIVCDRITNA